MISLGLTFGQQIAADGREFGVELVQQVVHYGGEFHFLRCYSLSIYDEGDREEGRIIARSLMEEDNGSYY